jgi:hypothetical protein
MLNDRSHTSTDMAFLSIHKMIGGKTSDTFNARSVSFEPTVIPGRHRPRFIDGESPPLEVFAVHFGNSLISAILHFYEAKTFGAAGVAIGNDTDGLNRTGLAEQFLEITLGRFKR